MDRLPLVSSIVTPIMYFLSEEPRGGLLLPAAHSYFR